MSIGHFQVVQHSILLDKSYMVDLKAVIQRRLEELDRSPLEAAISVGLERGYINDIVRDRKKSISPSKIAQVAKALDWTFEQAVEALGLDPNSKGVAALAPKDNASKPMQLVDRSLTATLPRYRSAHAGQGGAVLMDSLHDDINAPPTLAGIEGAFACFVHGDSMEPFLFAGDTVFCHPYVPPRGNDFVVIQIWERDHHGHLLGLVKQFVKQDADTVTVRQFNPPQDFTFPRERVKQVNKVVHIEKP